MLGSPVKSTRMSLTICHEGAFRVRNGFERRLIGHDLGEFGDAGAVEFLAHGAAPWLGAQGGPESGRPP